MVLGLWLILQELVAARLDTGPCHELADRSSSVLACLPHTKHYMVNCYSSMSAVQPGHCGMLQGLEGTGVSSLLQPAEQAVL